MKHSTHARQERIARASARSRASASLARRYAATLFALAVAMAAPPLIAQPSSFTDIGAGLQGVHHGSALWGDYDGDLALDLLLSGQTLHPLGLYTDLWQNSGGTFTPIGSGIIPTGGSNGRSRSAWGDYDNDGDIDVIVTGVPASGFVANLYRNDGGGTFTPETITPGPIPGVGGGAVAWGDYDNDGDLDLLMSSYLDLRIYRNDGPAAGGWKFNARTVSLRPWGNGDCAWGDYDNDGDLDIAVSGYGSNISIPSTAILQNHGGVFIPATGTASLVNLGYSSVAWGDYNNDGYLDLATSGIDASNTKRLYIFLNNSGGSFTRTISLTGVANGSLAWGDYNNDGNFDLLVTGLDNLPFLPDNPIATIYSGDGNGTFTEDPDAHLAGIFESQGVWGDYDNDGLLDILAAGNNGTDAVSSIYQNTSGSTPNTSPAAPPVVSWTASWKSLTMNWLSASDAQTPSPSLTYNIEVLDGITGVPVVSPMSDVTGPRLLPQIGNMGHNRSWTLTGLQPNHPYVVSCQTVDGAFKTSNYISPGGSITTPGTGPDVMIADCNTDVGIEPDDQCNVICYSPAIYIRNQQDGLLPGKAFDQTPVPGQTNWAYVKLKNIGSGTLSQGRVYLFWAKASTAIAWPVNWVNYYINGVLYGDMVGWADVTSLASNGSTTVEIPWTTVPNPNDFNDPDARHFCLVARFVAASDPMSTPEGPSIAENARNNNNIAWRNVTIYAPGDPSAPLDVANDQPGPVMTRLKFTDTDTEVEVPLVDLVEIRVDLGPVIFALWDAAGRSGEGVEVVSEDHDNTSIRILSSDAWISGLMFPADFRSTIRVEFIYPAEIPSNASPVYHWLIDQYSEEPDVYIGGEMYEVLMEAPPGGEKRSIQARHDLATALGLAARPNPTTGATMLNYTLPAQMRVTLAIYNSAGQVVRTLLDGAEQPAGGHELLWDGETAGGIPVVSGTYFYRLETPQGTVEKPIVIVR